MEHNLYDNDTDDYYDDDSDTHQTDTACLCLVCHSRGGGDCANCMHLPRLSGGPATQFFGEASHAYPKHGWRSAYSLRETLSPIQDGPLDVSRESSAPAGQMEETPSRASLEKLGCRTPPQLHVGGVGRQQQHDSDTLIMDLSDICDKLDDSEEENEGHLE